jgi:hypothetical protein
MLEGTYGEISFLSDLLRTDVEKARLPGYEV